MLELPHAAVGAAIVTAIPNPAISLPLALVSHFVMDLYPHWNPSPAKERRKYGRVTPATLTLIWLDSLAALAFGLVMAAALLPHFTQAAILLLGCFLGVLPDVVEIPHVFFDRRWPWLNRLTKFQASHQFKLPLLPGLLTQALVLVICFAIISARIHLFP